MSLPQRRAVPTDTLDLSFYGVTARVRADDPDVLQRISSDFHYFRTDDTDGTESPDRSDGSDGTRDLEIIVHHELPRYPNLPDLTASVHTPRNICFRDGDTTYIDYFGRALAIYTESPMRVEVWGKGVHLLHEIVYLTMLSRVGGLLESRGLHRMHALAIAVEGRTALFMMPSGCGKTTLGLGLLGHEIDLELVSDDSPLISTSGDVFPFPLRFGVIGEPPAEIDSRFVYPMERMEFAPKNLVSTQAFADVLASGKREPGIVFLGTRSMGYDCRIERVSRFTGFRESIRHMIVGIGLYQGLEFMLRSSVFDLWRSGWLVLSRARAAGATMRRSEVYRLVMGRDPAGNVEVIAEFLSERLGGVGEEERSS